MTNALSAVPDTDAYTQILHTMSVYHTALDTGDFAQFATVYTEDASHYFTNGHVITGRDDIASHLQRGRVKRYERYPDMFQRHNHTTRRIDLHDADHASSTSYVLVMSDLGLDHCAHYQDKLVRVGDRWLFSERRSVVDWSIPNSRFTASFAPTE